MLGKIVLLSLTTTVSLCFAQGALNPAPAGPNTPIFGKEQPRPDKEKETRTRPVRGVVRNVKDEVVQGAVVHTKNLRTGRARQTVTRADGTFNFDEVALNADHEFFAEFQGSKSRVRVLSQLNPQQKPIVNLALEPPADKKAAEAEKPKG